MIRVNIDWAISLYLFAALLSIFLLWLFYSKKSENDIALNSADMLQCNYCSFIFLMSNNKEIQICPKCKSYISADADTKTKPQKTKHKK